MEVSIARIDFSFLSATSKQLAEKQEPGRRGKAAPGEAPAGRGSGSRNQARGLSPFV